MPGERTPLAKSDRSDATQPETVGWWVRCVTFLSAFAEGYDIGAFAGAGVRIEQDFNLSENQLGLLFGVMYFAMGAGMLVSGRVADWMGRVPALLVTHVCLLIAACSLALAQDFNTLLMGRIGIGVGIGMGLAIEVLYISETSPASWRGFLGGGVEFFLNVGIVGGYLANYGLVGIEHDWRYMIGIGGIFPIMALIMIIGGFVPESPRYLMLCGNIKEAQKRLQQLIPDANEAAETFEKWEKEPEEMEGFMGLFRTPERRRMCLAGFGAGLAQMLSGVCMATSLSSHLMRVAGYSHKEAFWMTFVMGVAKTIAITFAVLFVVDQHGRRPLLIGSAAMMSLAAFGLSAAFAEELGYQALQWGFIAFSVFFSLGLGPAAYVYVGEVFDSPIRGAGVSLSLCLGRVCVGVVLWTVPPYVKDSVERVAVVFMIFGCSNALAAMYMYVFCPETRQKKLEDMRNLFRSPSVVA